MAGTRTAVEVGPGGDGRFPAFVRTAYPEVYGYLLNRSGRHPDVAEDLAQETFVAAVDAARRGQVDALTVPWLIGVARHKLADHYRRLERERRKFARAWSRRGRDTVDDVELHAGDPVAACLARLGPSERAALILHHVDDLPLEDVAKLMHRSVAGVNALTARARRHFEELYEEADDG